MASPSLGVRVSDSDGDALIKFLIPSLTGTGGRDYGARHPDGDRVPSDRHGRDRDSDGASDSVLNRHGHGVPVTVLAPSPSAGPGGGRWPRTIVTGMIMMTRTRTRNRSRTRMMQPIMILASG
jgi:hypothetical protein